MAHYSLESYKRSRQEQDDFELGRQVALVGIFKSRFLKRLESSIDAFRISIRRALEFVKTFAEYVQDGIILGAASFRMTMRLLEHDDEDAEDASPSSLATAMDGNDEARQIIDALPRLDAGKYDQRRLTDLDDGIHSGLERHDTKGMFFYFTASRESGRAHF